MRAKMGLTLFTIFSLSLLFIITASSAAEPDNPHPHPDPSFKTREAQQLARGCSYQVKIKTSCSSPRYTRDYISIAFGDAYRNEVYVPRLDDPASRAFERCSTDTYRLQGPCGYGICYLYLRRDGWDGWIPESVKIYEIDYRRTVSFYYNTPLPNAVWYGFNNCPRLVLAAANATEAATGGGLVSEMKSGDGAMFLALYA